MTHYSGSRENEHEGVGLVMNIFIGKEVESRDREEEKGKWKGTHV